MSHKRDLGEKKEDFLDGVGVPKPQPFIPDEFQLNAIESLKAGYDTLVIAPTGCGKTYIAVEGIADTVREGKRAIYTAPLKALSNAKYSEFRAKFEPDYKVGILTGDRKIEGDANIVIATTEIYRNDLYSMRGDYSLVVLDEIHYLADPQRGAVWEESIVLSPKHATLLMLSASISNPEEVAEWIYSVRGKKVSIIKVKERFVELRFGFLHPELGVLPLMDRDGQLDPDVKQYYSAGTRGVTSGIARKRGGGGYRGGPGRGWQKNRDKSGRAARKRGASNRGEE